MMSRGASRSARSALPRCSRMAHSLRNAPPEDEAHGHAEYSATLTFGFDIRLPSAQLADLIQINCHNRIRGAFRVSSGEKDGLLFFDAGQLVHAVAGDREGLEAMVVMLGWRGGNIEPCAVPWPATARRRTPSWPGA